MKYYLLKISYCDKKILIWRRRFIISYIPHKSNFMKKNYAILTASVILFISTSMTCEEQEPVETIPFAFKNECCEPIAYCYHYDNLLTAYNILYLDAISLEYLNSGDSVILDLYPGPCYSNFEIVIFKKSTLDTVPHRKLIEYNMHDALYRPSQELLKKLNYKIVYSGNE